jgi:tRNA G18 (ribose-2'-O)-methylase SpoU
MNQFDKNGQNRTEEELPADRLEGRNPILEALKAGRPINKLYVQRSKEKPDATLARIIHEAKEAGAVIMEVERQVLDQMSVTHGHQGVIAHVAMHEYAELADVLAKAKDAGEDPFLIILDELKESYNLGSVLRIADAAGVHGVIIPTLQLPKHRPVRSNTFQSSGSSICHKRLLNSKRKDFGLPEPIPQVSQIIMPLTGAAQWQSLLAVKAKASPSKFASTATF